MVIEVPVKVTKEAYELGQGLAKFHAAVKQAIADGWQITQDVPPIIQSAIVDLVPAMAGADQISAEGKEDVQAFANAIFLGLSDIGFQYGKK